MDPLLGEQEYTRRMPASLPNPAVDTVHVSLLSIRTLLRKVYREDILFLAFCHAILKPSGLSLLQILLKVTPMQLSILCWLLKHSRLQLLACVMQGGLMYVIIACLLI